MAAENEATKVPVDSTKAIQVSKKDLNGVTNEARKRIEAKMEQCNADHDKALTLSIQHDLLVNTNNELTAAKQELTQQVLDLNSALLAANKKVDSLTYAVKQCEEGQGPLVAILNNPLGCTAIVVMILCLTVIALKKGVKLSKGNANLSIGGSEDKK
ncbi:MAG: hypothetical protein MJY93_10305 [Fibrobacter sp.]|nr:hypothetical protein [Fibrobacter sp.]